LRESKATHSLKLDAVVVDGRLQRRTSEVLFTIDKDLGGSSFGRVLRNAETAIMSATHAAFVTTVIFAAWDLWDFYCSSRN
jgi:hypothetical protein